MRPRRRRPISNDLRLAVFVRDDFSCGHCGLWLLDQIPEAYDGTYAPQGCDEYGHLRHLQVDHILPVTRGGTNRLGNLQTLCDSCNAHKGTSLEDWESLRAMLEAMADGSRIARRELAELRSEGHC